MLKQKIEMVVTDLDGTLLNSDRKISVDDLDTLQRLGREGVCCVIATGRSLYSARKVLVENLPIDYLIFSSGAGILEWKSGTIIRSSSLAREEAEYAMRTLLALKLDFMIHEPIPDNHKFLYSRRGATNPDFERRCAIYKDFARPFDVTFNEREEVSQIVAITCSPDGVFERIQSELNQFSVIRTTSPLDGQSLWIEIFPQGVSKGQAADWLCRYVGVNPAKTLCIGNDYNDLDLLRWGKHRFVAASAPDDLKAEFEAIDSKNGILKDVVWKTSLG